MKRLDIPAGNEIIVVQLDQLPENAREIVQLLEQENADGHFYH